MTRDELLRKLSRLDLGRESAERFTSRNWSAEASFTSCTLRKPAEGFVGRNWTTAESIASQPSGESTE